MAQPALRRLPASDCSGGAASSLQTRHFALQLLDLLHLLTLGLVWAASLLLALLLALPVRHCRRWCRSSSS
jgi:hypothetical protein